MANTTKVRGITIQLGSDTSGIQRAFKDVDRQLDSTKSQLRDVERLLKLDPGNTELLAQKQRLLNQEVEKYNSKLQTLKQAQADFDKSQYSTQEAAQTAYDAIQREIISTEQALGKATNAMGDFNSATDQAPSKLDAVAVKAALVAEKTEGISKAGQAVIGAFAGFAVASVKEFADFEQNLGGVETFFKDNADVVRQYAEEAYKTAGLSANDYMETITGFSAALLKSLGGDTRTAAELANIAIIDMADNANKFGTSVESVQNAYQGFAKSNYTMLDNLKLGYAGTKEGMQQLLADAEKLTGVKFDINNYADIVMAIHEVQKAMGIAGTTATEAEGTITGSVNTLRAALSNLVLGFADADADVEKLADDTTAAFGRVLENVLPVIERIIGSLPGWAKLALGIAAVAAVISPLATVISVVSSVLSTLSAILPVVSAGLAAVQLSAGGVLAIILAVTAAIIGLSNALREWAANKTGLDVNTMPVNSDYGVPGLASGGILTHGSALVGEAGPEVLTMANGRAVVQPITNNYNTTNSYNQAGGSMQPLDVTLLLDRAVLARLMVDPNARAVNLAGESAIH